MSVDPTRERQTRFVAKLSNSILLSWNETSDSDAFQTKLAHFVVEIARRFDQYEGDKYYTVSLFDHNGKLIETISPGNIDNELFRSLTSQDRFAALETLFDYARRDALKVDEALEQATKELDKFVF
jgi:hypothetical protein